MHPDNEKEGILYLSSRYFEICWTLNDPYKHDPFYGRVAVLHDELPLTLMMCYGREVGVVEVGIVDKFPLDGILLSS